MGLVKSLKSLGESTLDADISDLIQVAQRLALIFRSMPQQKRFVAAASGRTKV